MKAIIVEIKFIYGNELIYPISAEALILAKLTGKKTLNRRDLELIKQLGYTIETQAPTL